MSDAATAAPPHPALVALGRAADALTRHVAIALAVLLSVQVVATVALFFSVNHNGWLTYQGGDQIWLVTSGWLLGQGEIGSAFTSYGWPLLMAPLTWITGSSSIDLLPLTTILQAGILAPIATLAVYDIGARLAGRLAGLWCAAVFVAAPFVAIPFFVERYHDSWVDQLLPQALGLTQQADFPSVVAVLVAAAFTVRALEAGAHREALLAGTFAGVALAVKPANALFLAAPLVAFVLARRWRQALLFGIALAPAALALTIWKAKGLGTVPLFAQSSVSVAAGLGDPVLAESWFQRTFDIDFETWKQNMSNLREFTWSARVIQFLPLAGALAVARRSVPVAGLLLTWLLAYVVVKGSASVATIESGSYWRLVMPALPAFALLAAAVPLLVPTFLGRMGDRLAPVPTRRPGFRGTVAAIVLFSIVPIARPARRLTATRGHEGHAPDPRPLEGDRPRQHRSPLGLRGRRPPRPPHRERKRAHVDRLDEARAHLLSRLPGNARRRVPRHGLRASRGRPLRAAVRDARHDPRPPVRRPRSPA